jgi:hypothetical protein
MLAAAVLAPAVLDKSPRASEKELSESAEAALAADAVTPGAPLEAAVVDVETKPNWALEGLTLSTCTKLSVSLPEVSSSGATVTTLSMYC